MVAPHLEQVPSLLEQVIDKSLQPNDAMIVNEPASNTAEPSTWPITSVDNMAILPYDDEDDLDLLYW